MFPRRVQVRRVAPWLLCLLSVLPGCMSWSGYRPIAIQVRDAETKQPIGGAEVRIWYPTEPPAKAGTNSRGLTQPDGIARMQVSSDPAACPLAELSAPGFLWEEKSLPGKDAKKNPHAVDVTFEMYAEPRPTGELVVPTGYRGVIEVKVQVHEDAPAVPSQRAFRAVVSPTGAAEVTGPPILHYVNGQGFQAKYADGTPIKRDVTEFDEVGFWWLKGEESDQLFLVGTKDEYEAHRRSAQDDGGKTRSSGGGKGGGRGGRGGGRHGGGSSDGSGANGNGPTVTVQ